MENNIEIDIDIKEYFEGLLLKSGFSVDNEKKEN